MGSAVKWVFCALFGTMSIVKLFHSFEYLKIPQTDSSWRCPLYCSIIFKSWLQLLSVSIFELPNKSPSFRLLHSANKKLLNVFHSRTGNTCFTPGMEVWSADRNVWFFFYSHGYERKRIIDSKYCFWPRYDPCETRFVGTHQSVTRAEHPLRIENKI